MRAILLLAVLVAFGAGCSRTSSPRAAATRAGPPRIDGAGAQRLVERGAVLLDVRTPEEFVEGHVEGALNLPVDQIDAAIPTLPRQRPVVVCCATGSRSQVAAMHLAAAGFDVHDLGAMENWNR